MTVLTMDKAILMWIGNAVHWALKLVMQFLLRDVTMIYRTKLWRLTDYAKKLLETSQETAQAPHDYRQISQCVILVHLLKFLGH